MASPILAPASYPAATASMISFPLFPSCCPRANAVGTVITARWVMLALCTSSMSITCPNTALRAAACSTVIFVKPGWKVEAWGAVSFPE